MKKRSNSETEYDFLKPLSKRPDLEPNPIFIQGLRKKLTKPSIGFNSNSPSKKMWPILIGFLALLTISVLYLSSLTDGKLNKETANSPITELLSSRPYYNAMYELVLKNTQSEKAAETLVLYLESLQQGDLSRIKKYSFLTNDFELQPLINHYQEVEYGTLAIEKITPSQAEPSYEVQLSYQLKNGASKEFRTMHINLYDGVNIDIYEDANQ